MFNYNEHHYPSREPLFLVKKEPPRTFAHRQAMILANFDHDFSGQSMYPEEGFVDVSY